MQEFFYYTPLYIGSLLKKSKVMGIWLSRVDRMAVSDAPVSILCSALTGSGIAKVVGHSRYITFQISQGLAVNAQQEERREAAVSRKIFAEILFQIERLRCCPA